MRKLIFLCAVCLFTLNCAWGQPVKLGVLLGPNVSTFLEPVSGETTSALVSFHAGVFTEFVVGPVSIEPGLVYESIGGKNNYTDSYGGGGVSTQTYSLQYLQVPVNIVFNTPGRKFFLGGGPFVAFGISGHISGNSTSGNFGFTPPYQQTIDQPYKFNGANNPDYGLNLLVGVHLEGGTIISIGYGLGLNSATNNNVFSLSLGHRIF